MINFLRAVGTESKVVVGKPKKKKVLGSNKVGHRKKPGQQRLSKALKNI